MKLKLKSDKYRKVRGGHSRFLKLYCDHCSKFLFLYQKDGPGPLKRLYLDRIDGQKNQLKILSCKHCKEILGTYYVYKKEKRPAYRLYVGSITKAR